MKRVVLQLMQAKQTNGAFKFSAFLRLVPFPKKQAHRGRARTLWDEDCAPSGSPVDTRLNKEEKDGTESNGIERLINTIIFIGVWLFMICKCLVSPVTTRVLICHKSSLNLVWLCYT